MDFTHKRVLVTGSSRGIGFAIAKAFLAAGARVAINGSTEHSVAAAIGKLGDRDRTVAAPGNIGTVAGCESAVQTAIEAFGGLDVLVNNAGVGAGRPIAACDEAMWDAHADVNLKGLFFCCRAAIPELRGLDVHEIHPVKFGGSPTSWGNKIPLPRAVHAEFSTWWDQLRRSIE